MFVGASSSVVMTGPTRHHRNQKSAALVMWCTLCGSGSACAAGGGFGGAH